MQHFNYLRQTVFVSLLPLPIRRVDAVSSLSLMEVNGKTGPHQCDGSKQFDPV